MLLGGRLCSTAHALLACHSAGQRYRSPAEQEGQNALEVSAGGLFTVQFLSELRRTKGGNFMTVFESTLQRVQQMSRQQQTPVALGDTTLGSTFAIAF
jgi:hypothetical protein